MHKSRDLMILFFWNLCFIIHIILNKMIILLLKDQKNCEQFVIILLYQIS